VLSLKLAPSQAPAQRESAQNLHPRPDHNVARGIMVTERNHTWIKSPLIYVNSRGDPTWRWFFRHERLNGALEAEIVIAI
jgi:hypothetical protein